MRDYVKELSRKEPESHIAYFPLECRYVAHIWGDMLTGFCETPQEAARQALNVLTRREEIKD